MTVEELKNLLQTLIEEGKGSYQVRSSEFEFHTPDENYFHVDDENKCLWYEA